MTKSSLILLGWVFLYCAPYALGEYTSKLFANNPSLKLALWALFIYVVCNTFWLLSLLSRNSISTMGAMMAAGAAIVSVMVGKFAFHEVITATSWVGIAFALVAIVLLSVA